MCFIFLLSFFSVDWCVNFGRPPTLKSVDTFSLWATIQPPKLGVAGGGATKKKKVWERFHLHWLSSTVPVHVVRYEDLLARPEGALTDLVAFIHVRDRCLFGGKTLNEIRKLNIEERRTPTTLCERDGTHSVVECVEFFCCVRGGC